jgi:hypothetical protein
MAIMTLDTVVSFATIAAFLFLSSKSDVGPQLFKPWLSTKQHAVTTALNFIAVLYNFVHPVLVTHML